MGASEVSARAPEVGLARLAGIYELNLATGVLVLSAEFADHLGLPNSIALEEVWAHHIHPDDRERVKAALSRATVSGSCVGAFRLLAPQGWTWICARSALGLDEAGRALRLTGAAVDLTLAIRSPGHESDSLRALASAVCGIRSAGWAYDSSTGEVSVSRDLADLFGVAAVEIGVTNLLAALKPEDAEKLQSACRRALGKGGPLHEDVSLDGPAARTLRILGEALPDATQPDRLQGILWETSDATRRGVESGASPSRLEMALSSGRMGSWDLDLRTQKLSWGQECARLFGFSAESFGNTVEGFERHLHPEDRISVESLLQRKPEEGHAYRSHYRIVDPSGDVRFFRSVGTFEFGSEGKPTALRGVAHEVTDIVRYERELRSANERLNLALSSAGMGTWEYNIRTKAHTGSEISAAIYETEGKDGVLPSEAFWSRVHPDYHAHLEERMGYALETGEKFEAIYPLVLPSGTERWVSAVGQVHYDADGMPFEVIGVVQDITTRKAFEARLAQANERLSLALDFAALGIWEIDIATNEAWFSDNAYRLYGFDPANPPTKAEMSALIFEEDLEANIGKFLSARDHGTPYETSYRIRRPDGEVRHMTSIGRMVPAKVGRNAQVLGVVQDVTERVKARESTEQLNERLTLALEAAGLGMWAIPAGNEGFDAHESLFRLFGVSNEEYDGREQALFDMVDPEDLGKNVTHFYEAQAKGQPYRTEYRIRRPDGEKRWLSSLGKALVDGRGNRIFLAVTQDVTERKEVERMPEERVAERTRELQEALTALETFSHSVSHDLRAPLRAIGGYARALREDHEERLGEEGTAMAQRIQSAAQKADRLVSDLLAFSRVSREQIELDTVDLDDCIRDALLQHEAELRRRGAQVAVNLRCGEARGNRATLTQVLSNLVSNAVKFVPESRTPEFAIESNMVGDEVEIAVLDNGVGVEPEYRESIFEPFVRLYSERQFPGTGIGLAIVARAVARMGGSVGVGERVPEGSRFWIRLAKARDGRA